MPAPKYISTHAASQLLDVTTQTIRTYIRKKHLKAKYDYETGRYFVLEKDVFCIMKDSNKAKIKRMCEKDYCNYSRMEKVREAKKKKGKKGKTTKAKSTRSKAKTTTKRSTKKKKEQLLLTTSLRSEDFIGVPKGMTRAQAKKAMEMAQEFTKKQTKRKKKQESKARKERLEQKRKKNINKLKRDLKKLDENNGRMTKAIARTFLGIRKKSPTPVEVVSTFKRLAKIYHPDKAKGHAEFELFTEYFKRLSSAMDKLA